MSLGVSQEEAGAHLSLLRKLHGQMVAANDTDGEAQVMDLIEVIKSSLMAELTDPEVIAERNQQPAPNLAELFEVEDEDEYPEGFEERLKEEAQGWEVYRVRLDKDLNKPLGFSLVGTNTSGVVIKDVFPGTAAAQVGTISISDRILAVGPKMLGKTAAAHKDAVSLLKQSTGTVELWMARPPPETAEPHWRHLEAVELHRSEPTEDLGITLGPGSKDHHVVVQSMAPGKVAARSDLLCEGDRILEVNRVNVTRTDVAGVGEAMNKPGDVVQLKIARMVSGEDPISTVLNEDEYDTLTVEVQRGDKGLGLTIAAYVGSGESRGIFVKEVVPGTSAAEQDVRGMDQIVEVDGKSLLGLENPEALKFLKATGGKTVLKLRRRKQKQEFGTEMSDEDLIAKWQPRVLPWEKVLVVTVQKDPTGGLGMGVEGRGATEDSDPSQNHHVVCSINPSGAVGRAGMLQHGDRLLQLSGKELPTCSHADAVLSLREAASTFRLVVARPMKEATDSAPAAAALAAAGVGAAAELDSPTSGAQSPPATDVVQPRIKSPVKAWEEPREVTLTKESHGRLGFSILDYDHPDNENEVIVLIRAVTSSSAAYGVLRENQRLLHVNGSNVDGLTLKEALPLLKSQPVGKVRLGIADPVASQSETSSTTETPNSQTISIPCAYGEIELGLDVDVERGREGVVIKTVLRNGAVAKDGRLSVGDRLLAVNGVKMDQKTPDFARIALHNAHHCDDHMRLTYAPGPRHGVAVGVGGLSSPPPSESPAKSVSSTRLPSLSAYNDPVTVTVARMPSGGVGISIVGGNTEVEEADGTTTRIHGIFIKHVLPDSPAGLGGQLKSGDRVLEVGGAKLDNASHNEAVAAIRSAGDPVTLVIQSLPATMRESRKDRIKREDQEKQEDSKRDPSPARTALLAAAKEKYGSRFDGFDLLIVTLVKGDTGLGLGLGSRDGKIIIGDIREGSSAAASGKLGIGDVLVEVNGTSLVDMSHADASNFLRLAPADLTAVVARPRKAVTPKASPKVSRVTAAAEGLKLTKDELREVVLVKPPTGGLGMGISKHKVDERILFIKSINPGSVASQNPRIRRGDHVIMINGVATKELEYAQAITMLKEAKGEVALVLGTLPPALLASPPQSPPPGAQAPNVQVIDLMKPATGGLGVSIVEKAHPTLEGKRAIFVADVVMDGVAYKDGRLQAGSRIMAVNGEDMSEAQQSQAVRALKAAVGKVVLVVQQLDSLPSSASTSAASTPAKPKLGATHRTAFSMTLDNTRSPPSASFEVDDDADEPRRVVINREPGQSLGMSVAGGIGSVAGDVPIFIAGMQPEGLAASTKQIQVGDRVLEVNGERVLCMTREQVVGILRASGSQVVLLVVRDSSSTTLNPKKTSATIAKEERRESEFRTVQIAKSAAGYGFSIVGGKDEAGTVFPIYIKEVVPDGAAAESGEVNCGDQLVAINSQKLEGMSCKQASQLILESTSEQLSLTLLS